MRLLGVSRVRGLRRPDGRKAVWALCVLSVLLPTPEVWAEGTPAGTQIKNWAEVRYEAPNGLAYSVASDTVVMTVAQVAGVDLEPPRYSLVDPGVTILFTHTLANVGNGADSFVLTASSALGWPARVYLDANRDGALDAGDSELTGPITLAADDTAHLLLAVDVPGSAAVRGTIETVELQAASDFDGSATDRVEDTIEVRDVGILVGLGKSVDLGSATIGDILTYTLDYSASGPNSATNLRIADPLPFGTSYLPGTLRLNGSPLTDAAGDDAGTYDVGTNAVLFAVGDITGGASGSASFQVRVEDLARQTANLTNQAAASYETFAGTDSVGSNAVQTAVVFPEFLLEKNMLGPAVAHVGDEIRYTLRYGNASSEVLAKNVVLSDTLPAGLEFVSSQPAATFNSPVLTWSLGDLAPGDTAQVELTVRVSDEIRDTTQATNVAVLSAENAENAEVAEADAISLVGLTADQLSLDKTADLLEVGLGETVPYTLTLENTGVVPLSDVRIHDRLPEGGRYSKGSLIGADSMRVSERDLEIFIAGPLAPGASHTIRYSVAIVSASQTTIANTAYATAEGEFVRSQDVVAWVQVRTVWPMETRAVIGKVWVDLNDDGLQERGEPGVSGIDIWTDDGEVSRSDNEGKFSFRNVRAGRHAFRLDPATVPVAYRLAGSGPAEDLVALDHDGWTTPRVNFRLVPRQARLLEVRLPVSWSLSARPLPLELPEPQPEPAQPEIVCVEAMEGEATLVGFEPNSARPPIDPEFVDRVSSALEQWPDCWLEIAGHSDKLPIRRGPYRDNFELSLARAQSVADLLAELGLESPRVLTRGYGDTQPIAQGDDRESLRRNRRVELKLIIPRDTISLRPPVPEPVIELEPPTPIVEYEVTIVNEYDLPLSGLSLHFAPAIDSAAVLAADSTLAPLDGHPLQLPEIAAGTRLVVRAWTTGQPESAVARLEGPSGAPAAELRTVVHNPLKPTSGVATGLIVSDSLPSPAAVPADAAVELVVQPVRSAWPELSYPLPAGWSVIDGSARLAGARAADPELRRDRDGHPSLFWRFADGAFGPVTLQLRPAGARAAVEPVAVPALRSAEERAAEKRREFLVGPAVEIFAPTDGTVLHSDRVFVGVRGERGAPVALFDGDALIAEANLRLDGVHDFIAIPLQRGPHRLRVRMTNSWQQERWDSLAVHVTGLPAQIVSAGPKLTLVADGHSTARLRARVLDRWGVPLVHPVSVTAEAEGAELVGDDADPAAAGFQARTDERGWVTLELRPGHEVGKGRLALKAGDAAAEVALEILPAIRPLMLTGVGRIGLGAAPEDFGSITARGRLDERTAVTLSFDTRRLDADRDFFGRSYDPLEESQYPLLGDASGQRTLSSSEYALSAKVERGFDWIALGDISTGEFSSGLSLTRYQRALPGAAARIATGPVVWKGFASSTTQSLRQLQIRGAGISGPYELEPNLRPGTDVVVIETRARENAQRILSQQSLVRYVDYQIDYTRGTLLLKRPLAAADGYGNPIFILVTFESESGGSREAVWGLRATSDASQLLQSEAIDSLRVGATFISDDADAGRKLAGADLRLIGYGGLDLGAELSYSNSSDSSGVAAALSGALGLLGGAARVSAGWTKVGGEYRNPSNLALRAGTEEVRAAGSLRVGDGQLQIAHERQSFEVEGVERRRTVGGIVQPLGSQLRVDARLAADRFENGASSDASDAGELKLTWSPNPKLSLYTEARHEFNGAGNTTIPDYLGAGATYQMWPGVSLETQHRQVLLPGDSADYSVTRVGLRSELGLGTQAWGSYEIAGGASGDHNAAVIGLNNRIRLGQAWSINSLFERRFGLNDASIVDPARALPFLQQEDDYWSAGLGVEFLPPELPYRASARAELRDGDFRSTRLVTLAGDVTFNRSLALLTRSEYRWGEQLLGGTAQSSERTSTLWGLAFRPIGSDKLNVLTKFEWLEERNPIGGGVLSSEGREERLIGVAEAIWAPTGRSEIGGRYAIRRSEAQLPLEDELVQDRVSWADYVGGRVKLELHSWLAFRADGRLLLEHTSDTRRWDAAPSLVFLPVAGFEAALGYRFGDLRDPDFAVRGGHGLFVVFGARLTETVNPTSADFWRSRFDDN